MIIAMVSVRKNVL